MKELRLGNVLVFISESGRFDWPQHERDNALPFRKQFITYIGRKTKKELLQILNNLDFKCFEIRQAKRLPYKWEAKIYGMAWDDVRALAINLK